MPIRRIKVLEADFRVEIDHYTGWAKDARIGSTCHLILGIDSDSIEGRAEFLEKWLLHFAESCGTFDPHAFASTVFLLVGRQDGPPRLPDEEIDRLVDAGACLREKGEGFDAEGVGLATALRADLVAAGLISAEEVEELGEATKFRGPGLDEGEAEALIGYYTNPPFRWPEPSVKQLFGDRSSDTTIPLAR